MLAKQLLEKLDRKIITASPETSISKAMDMLIDNRIGCLPVLDDRERLVGIISDKDIFRTIHRTKGQYHDLLVRDLMKVELIIGEPEDDLNYIAGLMEKNWIRHVPIVVGEKLVGLISQRDIVRNETSYTKIENRYLRLYMDDLHNRDRSSD